MKNLKLRQKVIFINIGVCIILTLLILLFNKNDQSFFGDVSFIFGIMCLITGGVNLFTGIILAMSRVKEWDTAFLISGGILLLLSGISCGSGLLTSY